VLIVESGRRWARRAGDLKGVQDALSHVGSGRNVLLTQLARTSNALLVEGDDFGIIRSIARNLELPKIANGTSIAPFPLEGFPSLDRLRTVRDVLREALGAGVFIAACFDRDNRCDEEIDEIRQSFRKYVDLLLILRRHEIENYLLSPRNVQRAIDR